MFKQTLKFQAIITFCSDQNYKKNLTLKFHGRLHPWVSLIFSLTFSLQQLSKASFISLEQSSELLSFLKTECVTEMVFVYDSLTPTLQQNIRKRGLIGYYGNL